MIGIYFIKNGKCKQLRILQKYGFSIIEVPAESQKNKRGETTKACFKFRTSLIFLIE